MIVLAVDTCLAACSVALATGADGVAVAHRFEARQTGHAEALPVMIRDVLADAGLAATAVDRIAVTHGPGGFTSVRIGLAAARGLALATGADIVTASSLHLIALALADRLATGAPISPHGAAAPNALAVAIDARRGQIFLQVFDTAGGPTSDVRLVDVAAANLALAPHTCVTGSGAALIADAHPHASLAIATDAATLLPDARALLRLAPHLSPAPSPRPLYLRAPDAKPAAAAFAAHDMETRA